jgi:hypothetical protein
VGFRECGDEPSGSGATELVSYEDRLTQKYEIRLSHLILSCRLRVLNS